MRAGEITAVMMTLEMRGRFFSSSLSNLLFFVCKYNCHSHVCSSTLLQCKWQAELSAAVVACGGFLGKKRDVDGTWPHRQLCQGSAVWSGGRRACKIKIWISVVITLYYGYYLLLYSLLHKQWTIGFEYQVNRKEFRRGKNFVCEAFFFGECFFFFSG